LFCNADAELAELDDEDDEEDDEEESEDDCSGELGVFSELSSFSSFSSFSSVVDLRRFIRCVLPISFKLQFVVVVGGSLPCFTNVSLRRLF
jgi:hypothetical protein